MFWLCALFSKTFVSFCPTGYCRERSACKGFIQGVQEGHMNQTWHNQTNLSHTYLSQRDKLCPCFSQRTAVSPCSWDQAAWAVHQCCLYGMGHKWDRWWIHSRASGNIQRWKTSWGRFGVGLQDCESQREPNLRHQISSWRHPFPELCLGFISESRSSPNQPGSKLTARQGLTGICLSV